MERIWIGISAQSVVLAHTKRATVTLIASALKTMSVEKTTALISGVMRNLLLTAVSQVIYIYVKQGETGFFISNCVRRRLLFAGIFFTLYPIFMTIR